MSFSSWRTVIIFVFFFSALIINFLVFSANDTSHSFSSSSSVSKQSNPTSNEQKEETNEVSTSNTSPPDNKILHLVWTNLARNQGSYSELCLGRFDLFRTFFLSSFVNSNPTPYPVFLVVRITNDLHPVIKDWLEEITAPYPNIFFSNATGRALNPEDTPLHLKEKFEEKHDFYISTRMDSDDVFGPDMFRTIQETTLERMAKRQDPKDSFAMTFPNCFKWHPSLYRHGAIVPNYIRTPAGGNTIIFPYPYNHYAIISLGQHTQTQKEISKANKRFPGLSRCVDCFIEISDRPMWIYIRSPTSDSNPHSKVSPKHWSEEESIRTIEHFKLDPSQVARTVEIQNTIAPRIEAEPSKGYNRGKHK